MSTLWVSWILKKMKSSLTSDLRCWPICVWSRSGWISLSGCCTRCRESLMISRTKSVSYNRNRRLMITAWCYLGKRVISVNDDELFHIWIYRSSDVDSQMSYTVWSHVPFIDWHLFVACVTAPSVSRGRLLSGFSPAFGSSSSVIKCVFN